MNTLQKARGIVLNSLPVVAMIGLIPFVRNDYALLVADILIIVISLSIKRERKEIMILIFGLVILTISEAFFVSTGVEVFLRRSLFGLMPIWLPVLWGYAFIAIKRSVRILEI